jgi:hypothetical protein
MNCLEFRRRLTIDPLDEDDALRAHEEGCDNCMRFARQIRADEIRLRAMLRAVTPPEGMEGRIRLAVRTERHAVTRRRWWYGAAAGVMIAVTGGLLSVGTTMLGGDGAELAQSVLEHIEDESAKLRRVDPVAAGVVRFVFSRFDARLVDDIGPVLFAAECPMRHQNGIHLVLPGQAGPITVFFMPGEVTDSDISVRSSRFHGYVTPTTWGSIAVVGERGEDLGGMGERLAQAVDWPLDGTAGLPGTTGMARLSPARISGSRSMLPASKG